MRPLPRAFRGALLISALLLSPSLVTAGEPLALGPDLTRRWVGRWESGRNGHRGPLRASFRRQGDARYRVVFRGRFFAVVPFRYAVTLDVTGYVGDKVLLSGASRLGPVFGTFTYSAEASDSDFVATFTSRDDHGTFVLHRRGSK